MNQNRDIELCNRLLRAELSAVETYALGIQRFHGEAVGPILESIRDDHLKSADALREFVGRMGGIPVSESGAWSVFSRRLAGAARLFGEDSLLLTLLHGEDLSRIDFEDAINGRDGLTPETRELIRGILLPRQQRHVSILRGLTAAR